MNAKVMIREAGCKGSVLLSTVNTIEAHESSLKNRLMKVERVLSMDVNSKGFLYKDLNVTQQSEPYKLMVGLSADIKQALTAVNNVKAIELIKRFEEQKVSYIHTKNFVIELSELLAKGLSENLYVEYIQTMNKFDHNGMDKGTNYSNTCIAFTKPEIHHAFQVAM